MQSPPFSVYAAGMILKTTTYDTMNRPCAAWQRRKVLYGAAGIQPFNEYSDVGGFAAASHRVFIISQSPGKMGLCKKPRPHLARESPFSGDAAAMFRPA